MKSCAPKPSRIIYSAPKYTRYAFTMRRRWHIRTVLVQAAFRQFVSFVVAPDTEDGLWTVVTKADEGGSAGVVAAGNAECTRKAR